LRKTFKKLGKSPPLPPPPLLLPKTTTNTKPTAYASHAVLSTLFPWLQGSTYDALLAAQLGGKAQPARAARDSILALSSDVVRRAIGGPSVEFAQGAEAAREVAAWRWRLAPMQKFAFLPQLGGAAPLVATAGRLDALAQNADAKKGAVFRPPADARRAADYETAYTLGNSTAPKRSAYDTASAAFWAGGTNTSGIPGHWLQISLTVLPEQTTVAETALFLARAFGAAWDASVAAYKLKYALLQWRPVTAFRQGYPARGGATAFPPDPSYTPLLMTPPHPEYPSGHTAAVGAVLEVLTRTLGRDAVVLRIGSEGAPALGERTYASLGAAAAEVGDSRVFGGVHFNASCADGLSLGRLVGGEAFDKLKMTGRGGGGKGRRLV